MTDAVHHLTRVVNGAVIGAKLDNRQPEWPRLPGAFRINLCDLCPQIAFIETVRVDAANQAKLKALLTTDMIILFMDL
ncbi:hypothetical protein CRX72_03685 [Pantoea sp. BRM17]|nr:hypothetical protein CRX72_03685 [Pantoea sp. BRM17]